ncbi:MAG: apolipoprotein N-acyltransferase [Alphaproteobacteria bacterium]|nr:apolipoprotein N-acyltransferase [Alphaproteobacteria bacterium]
MIYLALFVAGSLSALALAPFNITPVLIAALAFLFLQLKTASVGKSFVETYVFSLGYFVFGLYWIGNALLVEGNPYKWVWPLSVIGLPVLLSFFPALGGALFAFLKRDNAPWKNIISFAVAFMLMDVARGTLFTGFPWNLWGHAWSGILPILQTLSIWGVYGLSLYTLVIAAYIATLAQGATLHTWKTKIPGFSLLLVILLVPYGWGAWRLAVNPTELSDKTIRIVQPNIPQHEKWDSRLIPDHFLKLLTLSQGDEDYIVWPESAFPAFFLDVTPAVNDWRKSIKPQQTVLSGTLRGEDDIYFNSLAAINGNSEIINLYNKSHLVPFGEYIPFQKYIPLAPIARFSGFETGNGAITQKAGDLLYSSLVCYEIIFTGQVVNKKQAQPDVLINVTNDAWYGVSPGPFQHWQQGVYRAIEEGIPVIRSANTGISGIIDSYGRPLLRTSLHTQEAVTSKLPKKPVKSTVYSRVYYLPLIVLGLIWIVGIAGWSAILLRGSKA